MKENPIINKRYAWAEINLSNLSYNIKKIRVLSASRDVRIMAVVKANAYGHGAVAISKQAIKSGAYALGVAMVEEGMELRRSGIAAPIYVLGESPPETVEEAIKNNLTLTVNSYGSAQFISSGCKETGIDAAVNINIDTGMNRIGINFKEAPGEILKISMLPHLKLESISTHYACAGISGDSYMKLQWRRFEEAINEIKTRKVPVKFYHCANSPAFFRYKNMHLDMVRTGISIYGLNPYDPDYDKWLDPETKEAVSSLKPVLSLKAKITFIKNLPEGCRVSYCGTFKTARESIIATIPVGYADGYSRLLSNKARILINGKAAQVVGNITMDQFMVDITDAANNGNINVGSEVVLIGSSGGERITAEDIAGIMGTINYETVCMIKSRIPRIYLQ